MEQHDTPDLAAFMLARLDEDERMAWGCVGDDLAYGWRATGGGSVLDLDGADVVVRTGSTPTAEEAEHIARHDPARVLAEVEAKRRIVELHGHRPEQTWEGATITGDCRECIDEHYPCLTLRLLALPEAGHPDYREEWRP